MLLLLLLVLWVGHLVLLLQLVWLDSDQVGGLSVDNFFLLLDEIARSAAACAEAVGTS